MNMKKFIGIILGLTLILGITYYFLPKKANPIKNGNIVLQPARVTNYETVKTKLSGSKDFPIF